MNIEVTAAVTAVTVYSEQARITACAEVALKAGAHKLVIDDLPLTLDVASLRAGGSGTAQVRVHGVDVRRRHHEEPPVATVRELEARIEELEDELKVIVDGQEVLEAQGRYLDGLRSASEQFARGLALGRTSIEDQAKISRSLQEQDTALRGEARALERKGREVNRTLDKVRRELEQIKSARPRESNQAVIELEVMSPGEFQAELVYNVSRAAWKPIYDVRLIQAEDGHVLEVLAIAQITQSTGQDWRDVDLTVSTARTEMNRRLPELKPWYVDVFRPPVARAAPAPLKGSAARQARFGATLSDAAVDIAAEPAMATVMTEEGGATVNFGVAKKGQIPSDGSPHKTMLFESRQPASVDYIAVPKLTDAAFRRMRATNAGTVPLLAGTVQLFVGERYVGASRIDYVPAGDDVEMMLGVEERVTVKRELVRRDVDKARLRDKRQIQYGYEITIKNLLSESVDVEVHDHLPVSRHEDIKIKLLDCSPEPTERDELNLMEWHLKLDAGAEDRVVYQYQVEHPRSIKVTGLVD
jgi:uncharacterized protein (TIGR02231 family)